MSEYPAFRKIPRLSHPVVITEKIDGTNALISIERERWGYSEACDDPTAIVIQDETEHDPETEFPLHQFVVRAGSRKRWLTLAEDNYGFRAWVQDNAQQLVELGPGNHYGEWHGRGIQRGYGLPDKRLALFNVARWYDPRADNPDDRLTEFPRATAVPECVTVVPWITSGSGRDLNLLANASLRILKNGGTLVADATGPAEGVIIFHTSAGQLFKALIENDDIPKSAALKVAA